MIRLVTEARARGATAKTQVMTEWDIAGRCQRPHTVELWSRPPAPHRRLAALDKQAQITAKAVMLHFPGAEVTAIRSAKRGLPKYVGIEPGTAHSLGLTLQVKCRQCPACLKSREYLWRMRALQELRGGFRNWFGTLTLKPDEQALARARAQARATRQGSTFETFDEATQFRLVVREIMPMITRWLKRVRKESGTRFRYLLVTEAHKSGLPHFHFLLHERDALKPVKKRTLQAQWASHGFSNVKLVNGETRGEYVCKYLGKSSLARVRASGRYGQ